MLYYALNIYGTMDTSLSSPPAEVGGESTDGVIQAFHPCSRRRSDLVPEEVSPPRKSSAHFSHFSHIFRFVHIWHYNETMVRVVRIKLHAFHGCLDEWPNYVPFFLFEHSFNARRHIQRADFSTSYSIN